MSGNNERISRAVVTEPDREHRVARDKEERLRLALEAASIGVWDWDIRKGDMAWPQAAEVIDGLSQGHLAGEFQNYLQEIHPDDRERVMKSIARAVKARDRFEVEYRTERPDGSYFWTVARGRVLSDESGSPSRLVGVNIDATDRKEIELELERNRNLLQTTLHSIGDAVIAADVNACVTFMNATAEKLTGWEESEAFGHPARDVLHLINEATREPIEGPIARALQERAPVGLMNHTVLVSRSGAEYSIDDSAAPIFNEQGGLLGVVLVFRDITERRQQDIALERQAQLLDLAHDTIFVYDLNNTIIFWNHSAEEMYGWPREEAVGKRAYEFLHTQFPESLEAVKAALVKTGRWEGELVHTCRDGRRIVVESRWALQRDEDGRPLAILEINRDITSQKRAEEELRRSEQQYRAIVETANEGVWLIDTKSRTLYVNRRMAAILGCESEDTLARSLLDFVFPDDLPAARQHLEANLKGLPEQYDFRFRRLDGSAVLVLAGTSPMLDANGRIIGALGMYTDITDRKRAQAEAEVRARQQKALATLGVQALSQMPLQDWMDEVVRTVGHTLDVEHCVLLKLMPGGKELLLEAGIGWKEGLAGHALVPAGMDTLAGYTLASTEPVVVNDLRSETRFRASALLLEHGVVSGISVLIYQGHGKPWGVMGAHSTHKRAFTQDDVAFFQGVANLMGLVLERHGHEQQLQEYTTRIEALNERLQRAMSETHHRVKNNLQIISALVDMQVLQHPDAVPISQLHRFTQHIRALAAIHDLLTQQAKNDAEVEYLSVRAAMDKLEPMVQAMVVDRHIHFDVQDAQLPVRTGTALAVLVNELVSNAIKHGSGGITVLFRLEDHTARLEVDDEGPGFPEEFNPAVTGSTGLGLIESLSRWDLQGTVRYLNRKEGGASVVVEFPASHHDVASDGGKG